MKYGSMNWIPDNDDMDNDMPEVNPNEHEIQKREHMSGKIYDDMPVIDKLHAIARAASCVVRLTVFPDGSGDVDVKLPFGSMVELDNALEKAGRL